MSPIVVRTTVPVKDVMTSPVITVLEDDTVEQAAKLIADHNVGSIVVINYKGNPVGLITERDMAARVTAKNLLPSKVKAKEVMSTPLRTIDPNIDIKDAAEMMQKNGFRRLIVMNGDKMAGIVTSRDIIAITPALIEIIMEKAMITQGLPSAREPSAYAGYCDRCGQWSEILVNVEGKFICEDCRIDMQAE